MKFKEMYSGSLGRFVSGNKEVTVTTRKKRKAKYCAMDLLTHSPAKFNGVLSCLVQ